MTEQTSNFADMFNLNAEDFEQKTNESVVYKVKPSAGKNGVYSSLIRFVPWHKDPKNSYVDKWEAWLQNPITKKGMSVDCASSIGEPSELMDTFWGLQNSDDPELKEKAKYFSRKRHFYAVIQILKDENRPELEGKLKIFKFGIKIFDKIQAELKPEFGKPHVPFDPTNGKPFHIKCKEVGGYTNYDESKFLEESVPVFVGKDKKFDTMEELGKFLQENSPNLDDFSFRPWGEREQTHFDQLKELVIPSVSNSVKTATTNDSKHNDPLVDDVPELTAKDAPVVDDKKEANNSNEFEFNL